MNEIKLGIITETDYRTLIKGKDLPLWANEYALNAYKQFVILGVKKKDILICSFIAPLYEDKSDGLVVKRTFRFLPYMMPLYWEEISPLLKKEVVRLLFEYLFSNYKYTYIPMHPDFLECAAIASIAGFVEMRQTHILHNIPAYPNSVKQKVKKAKKEVIVSVSRNPDDFMFDKAIKGSDSEVELRKQLAIDLLNNNKAFTFLGVQNESVKAGIFIALDNEWGYLLHSWKDSDSNKGIIPLLITEAVSYLFDNNIINVFDFEGSVIDSIDDFFTSFNSETITYPYIHYAKEKERFIELINRSMSIPGRIICKEENHEDF